MKNKFYRCLTVKNKLKTEKVSGEFIEQKIGSSWFYYFDNFNTWDQINKLNKNIKCKLMAGLN